MFRTAMIRTTQASAASSMMRRPMMGAFMGVRNYHEKVLDHYSRPRNVGSMDKTDNNVGTGLVGAPACGDVMKLQIRVDKDGNIEEAKFKTFGCGSAIASSSYLTELVKGMSLDQAARIKNTVIAKELSLPPVKLHCSMLAEDAIKSAIKDYQSKRKTTTLGVNAAEVIAPTATTTTATSTAESSKVH